MRGAVDIDSQNLWPWDYLDHVQPPLSPAVTSSFKPQHSLAQGAAMAESICLAALRRALQDGPGASLNRAIMLFKLQPFWLYGTPPGPAKTPALATRLRQRVILFLSGQWAALHDLASTAINSNSRPKRPGPPTAPDPVAKAERLATHGELARAAAALTPTSPHLPFDSRVEAQTRQLLPAEPTAFRPVPPHQEPQDIAIDTLIDVIRGLPCGSGSGPSGRRFEHVKTLLLVPSAVTDLLHVFNVVLSGEAPNCLLDALFSPKLVPLAKPSGGVRPIMVEDALGRLLSKCVVHTCLRSASLALRPFQFGVQVSGGADTIVHVTRSLYSAGQGRGILAIDFANAFGSIHRSAISAALEDINAPDLIRRFFNAAYSRPTAALVTGPMQPAEPILVSTGILQGDPLSPFIFAATLHSVLQHTSYQLSSSTILAFLDDVTICGPPAELAAALETIGPAAARIGLSLNKLKTKYLPPTNSSAHLPIPTALLQVSLAVEGIELLGAPVGSDDFCQDFVHTRLNEQTQLINSLGRMRRLQTRLLTLRHLINTRLNYLFRTSPIEATSQLVPALSTTIRTWLGAIIDVAPDTLAPTSIPGLLTRAKISTGGLGIHDFNSDLDFVHFSSFCDAMATMTVVAPNIAALLPQQFSACTSPIQAAHQRALAMATARSQAYTPAAQLLIGLSTGRPDSWGRGLQRRLHGMSQDADLAQCWLLATSPEERALMHSRSAAGFGAFLLACPSDPFMVMSDQQLQVALQTHLGLPYLRPRLHPSLGHDSRPDPAFQPSCPCHPDQEPTDGHVMGCKKFDRFSVHNIIRDNIAAMLQSTAITTRLEQQVDAQRRTDVTACNFQADGKDLHLDISITSALSASYIAQAAKAPLSAANARCTRKVSKYKAAIDALRADFMPVVIEASGAFHGNVIKLIQLASLRVNNAGPTRATRLSPNFVTYWTQRLSVRLHAAIADKLLRAHDNLLRNARAAMGFVNHFQGV